MVPILRPASADDIPHLVKARLSFLSALGLSIETEDVKPAAKQISIFLDDHLGQDVFAFIAIDDDQIAAAGFLQVYQVMWQPTAPTGQFGRIINILTWPPYRHEGLARAIMQELIAKAKELGLPYIDLDASPEGQPLYESLGFELTHAAHPPMRLRLKN